MYQRMKTIAVFYLVSILLLTVVSYEALAGRNLVLFIGDGMGQNYIHGARNYLRETTKDHSALLTFDTLPHTAIVRTSSADCVVTDSAAAATAMASGAKTNNGIIGQDATAKRNKEDGKALESIAHIAKKLGLGVGMITTTRMTHATPAAFYAHCNERDREEVIALQLLHFEPDVAIGGGLKYFVNEKGNKLDSLRGKSYCLATDLETFRNCSKEIKRGQKLLALLGEEHLDFDYDRKANEFPQPSLAEMTKRAIEILHRNYPKGFFLMVEGGRIDHAGHANDALRAFTDTLALDLAVKEAVSSLNKKESLVLVTADHETGGLAINGYPASGTSLFDPALDEERAYITYPTITWATGPGRGRAEKLGLPLKENLRKSRRERGKAYATPPSSKEAQFSLVDLEMAAHTGVDVTLFAWGAQAERVHGTIENTDIFHIMRRFLAE